MIADRDDDVQDEDGIATTRITITRRYYPNADTAESRDRVEVAVDGPTSLVDPKDDDQ